MARIKWAKNPLDECEHTWDAREGETMTYRDIEGKTVTKPVRGPHRCVKDRLHVDDITDDDHQCCCGNSSWVP